MENITVNVFDDVLYLAWEFVYLIFFTRFVCVHGNYKNACAILISIYYSHKNYNCFLLEQNINNNSDLYYFTFTEKMDFKFLFNVIFYYEIYK